ncbi:MAG: hypothetical protein KGK08_08715 [Acidobacteriota bacterium]|nr:hypothetical protein [Acidobacteriota bacterium]
MSSQRTPIRPHSSYNNPSAAAGYSVAGVAIRCTHCAAQDFRRSRLRIDDLSRILRMQYPVRCLYCSHRQFVSFTLAALSVPSHIRQRNARALLQQSRHRSELDASQESLADTTQQR